MDFYDWLSVIFLIFIFGRLLSTNPAQRTITAIAGIFCLLMVFEASNRVLGYPDRKYIVLEAIITIIQMALVGAIIWQIKKQTLVNRLVWLIVLLINIYFPVITLPASWLRHYMTLHQTESAIIRWRPNAIITKVTADHIFVLQDLRDKNGATYTKAVSYYWDKENTPRAESEADLLDGRGSMQAQSPNQPYKLLVKMQAKIKGI